MAGHEVGTAYLSVLPKSDGFYNKLSRDLEGPFTKAGQRGGAALGKGVQSSGGGGFLAAGSKYGKIFAAGFAAIGGIKVAEAIAGFVGDAIDAASNLAETQSKVGQIFGDAQGEVNKFASGAADSLGQSKQAALDGASTFGIFGKSAGLAGKPLADFSTGMLSLAGDLASFNNTSTEDAITAIGAALRGESEPIRAYGVLLDDATLKNRAMALGIIKSTKESLTPQQRVLAAHAEILAQTSTQQGDFARTSDGLANSQRIFNATLENTKAEIGTSLLPVVTDLFHTFSEVGLPALKEVAKWFGENEDTVRSMVVAFVDSGLLLAQVFLGFMEHMARMNDFWLTVGTNMIQTWLNVVSAILNGAVQAFGWVPGLGDKLKTARAGFDKFREGIDDNFSRMRIAADQTTQMFDHAQDSVAGLREKVQALDGTKATVYLNAAGNLVTKGKDGSQRVAGGGISFRASGGPVVAGQPYIVGENGPELFAPDRSGMIYNRSQLTAVGGNPGNTFNVNVGADAPVARRYAEDVAAQTVRAWQNAVAVHGVAAAV